MAIEFTKDQIRHLMVRTREWTPELQEELRAKTEIWAKLEREEQRLTLQDDTQQHVTMQVRHGRGLRM